VKRRVWMVAVVLLCSIAILVALGSRSETVRSARCTIAPRTVTTGRIAPSDVEIVSSAAECLVEEVVRAGSMVRAGETIAVVSCRGDSLSPIFEPMRSLVRAEVGEDRDRVVAARALVVLEAPMGPGATLAEGAIFLAVADAAEAEVVIELDPIDADALRARAPATISALSGGPVLARGVLESLAGRVVARQHAASEPAALVREGIVTLRSRGDLALGREVEVSIERAAIRGVCVPRSSVGFEDGRSFVLEPSIPFARTIDVEVRAVDARRALVSGIGAGRSIAREVE
jgi:hypothetical protein